MSIKKHPHADENGNLKNHNNPFIKETNKNPEKENLNESVNIPSINNSQVSKENKEYLFEFVK